MCKPGVLFQYVSGAIDRLHEHRQGANWPISLSNAQMDTVLDSDPVAAELCATRSRLQDSGD